MSANLKEERLQETRAEPGSQQTKCCSSNRPADHVQEDHGQDIPGSSAESDSDADFPGLLSHEESDDAIDTNPGKQYAHACK